MENNAEIIASLWVFLCLSLESVSFSLLTFYGGDDLIVERPFFFKLEFAFAGMLGPGPKLSDLCHYQLALSLSLSLSLSFSLFLSISLYLSRPLCVYLPLPREL